MKPRRSLLVVWLNEIRTTGLLGLFLISAGCDRAPPAENKGTPVPGTKSEASSAPTAAPSVALPAAEAKAQEAPAKTASPSVTTPRAHSDVLALVDFTKFPKIDGATRQSSSALNASFTIPKKSAADFQRAVEVITAFLSAEGWKSVTDPLATGWAEDGGSALYQKEGVIVEASAGVTRGFPSGEDVNAGIFLVGEVDSRTLPRLPGSQVEREGFTHSSYTSPVALMDVRKFHKESFAALGWKEYRDNPPVGYEPKMEELEATQSFMRNGATIGYRLEKKGTQTVLSVRSGLLERALPLPPAMSGVMKWQSSPLRLICDLKMTPPEVFAWFQTEMGKSGWTAKEVPPVEERTVRHEFRKTGEKPLFLECLLSGKTTLMILRE